MPLLKASDFKCISEQDKFQELHQMLLERRDGAIAHADWAYHHTEFLSVRDTAVYRRIATPKMMQGIDISLFMQLAEAVRQEAMSKSHAIDSAAE